MKGRPAAAEDRPFPSGQGREQAVAPRAGGGAGQGAERCAPRRPAFRNRNSVVLAVPRPGEETEPDGALAGTASGQLCGAGSCDCGGRSAPARPALALSGAAPQVAGGPEVE